MLSGGAICWEVSRRGIIHVAGAMRWVEDWTARVMLHFAVWAAGGSVLWVVALLGVLAHLVKMFATIA